MALLDDGAIFFAVAYAGLMIDKRLRLVARFGSFDCNLLKRHRYNHIMISALPISTAGMTAAADRLEDIAIGIANPVPENAEQPAIKAERDVKPEEPVAPVSASPSLDPQKLVELIEVETAFKANAMATKTIVAASQDLMEALR